MERKIKMLMECSMPQRNGRVMNRMDAQSRQVHAQLEAWAKWTKENTQGLPAVTILGRMIEYGALGAAQGSDAPVSMPAYVAAVDAAVAHLGDIDKRAIKIYYLRWEPIEVMARRMHKSVRQYQAILQRARWRIRLTLNEI